MYLPIHAGGAAALAGGVVTTVSSISSANGMLTTYYAPLSAALTSASPNFYASNTLL